jgi:hypothetical protein
MSKYQLIMLISVLAFTVNIPFGILRTKYKKFSLGWFLCIHAPIPIVAGIRIFSRVSLCFIPLFLIVSIAGQVIGSRIKNLS